LRRHRDRATPRVAPKGSRRARRGSPDVHDQLVVTPARRMVPLPGASCDAWNQPTASDRWVGRLEPCGERSMRWKAVARSRPVLAATSLAAVGLATLPMTTDARPRGAATPIQHLVVIFQENVSFDHYFGTYPNATNGSGQPFTAARHTPSVNG